MEVATWIAAGYLLALPVGFTLEGSDVALQDVPPRAPASYTTTCRWVNRDGQRVTLVWWSPSLPMHAGGPMVAAHSETAEWALAPAQTAVTSLFQGRPQEVVVAFQQVPTLNAYARVHADGLDLAALKRMLQASRLRAIGAQDARHDGCRALSRQEHASRERN